MIDILASQGNLRLESLKIKNKKNLKNFFKKNFISGIM